ncbi:MAG: hypothetical protein ACM3MK_13020 [Chitinophagales bacterium]
MIRILKALQSNLVFTNIDILRLRQQVSLDIGSNNMAVSLANAIHQSLDSNLPLFTIEQKQQLRLALLRESVCTNNYDIDAAKVLFYSLLPGHPEDEQYTNALTWWTNKQGSVIIKNVVLQKLSELIDFYSTTNPNLDLLSFIESLQKESLTELSKPIVYRKRSLTKTADVSRNVSFQSMYIEQFSNFTKAEPLKASFEKPIVQNKKKNKLQPKRSNPLPIGYVKRALVASVITFAILNHQPAYSSSLCAYEPPEPLRVRLYSAGTEFDSVSNSPKPATVYSIPKPASSEAVKYASITEENKQSIPDPDSDTVPVEAEVNKDPSAVGYTAPSEAVEPQTLRGSALPESLRFKKVNENALKQYLAEENSLLVDEPYFSTVLSTAEQYDVNPLLLFAVAGQEQGFVPRSASNARLIANNPFNVHGSWKKYNTNITDSARIAAETLIHLGSNLPAGVEPLVWINRKYAEDTTWASKVRIILNDLESASAL